MQVTIDLMKREVQHLRAMSKQSKLPIETLATAMVELVCAWAREQKKAAQGKMIEVRDVFYSATPVKSYASVREAADALFLHPRLIYAVLHGKRRHTGGYSFTYKD